ncbi:MAG TPA: hypothetical protein VKP69_13280, partial [Isosphaeraceae bacterium]|nr:hypothetical protein [Isosphaeraceae bacterium]
MVLLGNFETHVVTDLATGNACFNFPSATTGAFSSDSKTVALARRGRPEKMLLADGTGWSSSQLSDSTIHLLDSSTGE